MNDNTPKEDAGPARVSADVAPPGCTREDKIRSSEPPPVEADNPVSDQTRSEAEESSVDQEIEVLPEELERGSSDGQAEDAEEESGPVLAAVLEQERARHREDLLRKQAELENLRKRTLRDVEHAHKFALEGFLQALIPVLDSLEQGLAASEARDETDELREGMTLIHKQLVTALEKFDVSILDPVQEKFAPDRHQAVSTRSDSGADRGTVLSVFQKGYLLHGRVLRPAMVVVAD